MEKLSGLPSLLPVQPVASYHDLQLYANLTQIKADAIIASSFEEVLYLDSDNIPLRDPTYLFDTELYAGEGRPRAVFWSDITKDHRKSAKNLYLCASVLLHMCCGTNETL